MFTVKFLYTVDQLDRFYQELKTGENRERIKISTEKQKRKKQEKKYIPQTDE